MPGYIERAERLTLPVLPVRGIVAFPSITFNFEIAVDSSIEAVKSANENGSHIFIVAQKDLSEKEATETGLFATGTLARIKQSIKTPEGHMRIIAEGLSRAGVIVYRRTGAHLEADVICKTIQIADTSDIKVEALMREAVKSLENVTKFLPAVSSDIILAAKGIKNPGMLADFIASNVLVRFEDKQKVLECFEPLERLELLSVILESEAKLLDCEMDINKKVRAQLDAHQRDYYLREQIKVIQNELGDGSAAEYDEYYDRIMEAHFPAEIEEKLLKENDRMAKTPYGSAEYSILHNYLDLCLEIPMSRSTKDKLNIASARKILDQDHDGMEKIKDRILEFLAVKQLSPGLGNQIICLVGPPGVGKTSIAASIARALGRKYVRVSLGGVRDEADMRGHRKTYVGAMPGRIISALSQAKVKNPLILLDEIDKLTRDSHGDPSSALLEVLDSEQNKSFRDHFVEFAVDLSDCLFIATANTLETVPRPLIDRMEIIELSTYTRTEKIKIAENHLIPKQIKRHGMNGRMLKITEDALIEIIDYYTREAGVRNLERVIAELCRKTAKELIEQSKKRVTIKAEDVKKYLGGRKLIPDKIADEDEIGVVNGLAYTEVGGDLLKIETAILPGTGKIELTGSLGDVMKESAKAAISYIRSIADELGIDPDFYKTKDIHIHVPEGAVPKDGPSAGVSILTSLTSALTGRPIYRDIAMTGEITLRGNVLAIGGLKEKTMAAYSAGVKRVLIPEANLKDLEEIDRAAREGLTFIPCKKAADVLANALLPTAPKTQSEKPGKEYVISPADFSNSPTLRLG